MSESQALEMLDKAADGSDEGFARTLDAALRQWSPAEVAAAAYELIWKTGKVNLLGCLRICDGFRVRTGACHTVALYHYRFGIGGAEYVSLHLANLLASAGYRVVLLHDEPLPPDLQISPSITCETLPPFESSRVDNYLERAIKLQCALKRNGVDLLIYNQWISHTLPWDLMVAKALGIAFVIHVHGSFPTMLRWSAQHLPLLPIAYHAADAVVCLSRMNAAFWSMVNERVLITDNPIRYSCRNEQHASLASHDVVWVARLDPGKLPEDALVIFQKVVAAVPDARLHLVGGGDACYREALEASAKTLGIGESVDFHGAQADPRPFYRKSSAMLMTSKEEGYPLVVGESKVFGLPVVMYDLPYLTYCENPRGLITVPQGDCEGAACALIALLKDTDTRMTLGKEAREDAERLETYDRLSFWKGVLEMAMSKRDLCPQESKADETLRDSWRMQSLFWTELFQTTRKNAAAADGTRRERDAALARINELEDSTAMRVGRLITALPRAVKGSIR